MSSPNLSAFIWSVADLLRGDFKQSEYGKVILPFTVLRRLAARKGKVQLIDASGFWQKLRKTLGSKRSELSEAHIDEVTLLRGAPSGIPVAVPLHRPWRS